MEQPAFSAGKSQVPPSGGTDAGTAPADYDRLASLAKRVRAELAAADGKPLSPQLWQELSAAVAGLTDA